MPGLFLGLLLWVLSGCSPPYALDEGRQIAGMNVSPVIGGRRDTIACKYAARSDHR